MRSRPMLAVVLGVLCTATVGCGTRAKERAATASLGTNEASPSISVPAAAGVVPDAAWAAPTPSTGPAAGDVAGTAALSAAIGPAAATASGEQAKTPAAGGAAVSGAATTPGGSTSGRPGSSPPAAADLPTPVPAAPSAASRKSPLVLGSVGTISGPVGATLLPVLQGAQVWVRYINAKGGLNGHAVTLIVYDDGGDPARHKAYVQEAVERKKVMGFLSNLSGVTGQASQDYINAKRVPVMGSETAGDYFYNSPMYFPQASHGAPGMASAPRAAAQVLLPAGKKKVAVVTCVEAPPCDPVTREWNQGSKKLGFDVVYSTRTSLTAPDYTAECFSARNAGAQAVFLGVDPASIQRFAASCARQGYRPTYVAYAALLTDRMKDDANLEGMIGAATVFPYFQSGTPATDEYHQALEQYGRGLPLGIGTSTGWVTGKMLEKAGAALPEPPTSEALLRGLWSLRNETLAGLTPTPLTFVENQNAKPATCWFTIVIRDDKWVSFDGYRAHCA